MVRFLWILLTVFAVGVLICTHELGHFLVAKRLRFPISEYSIGIGPALVKWRRGGILYAVRLIPAGGYVAFTKDEDLGSDLPAFQRQPLGHRFWVTVAGPLTNFLLALVIASLVLVGWGVGVTIPRVDTVEPGSPAAAAGLLPGDDVVSVNGEKVDGDYPAFQRIMAQNRGEEIILVLRRDGALEERKLTPRPDETGTRYVIGITVGYEYRHIPILTAVKQAALWVVGMVGEMLTFVAGLFRGQGTEDVSGVVGAVSVIAESGQTYGMSSFLTMAAYLSINLGVMNLLPLPVLDGGKVLLMGLEKLRGKPLPVEKEGIMNLIFLGLLFALFILLTFRDVGQIIGG